MIRAAARSPVIGAALLLSAAPAPQRPAHWQLSAPAGLVAAPGAPVALRLSAGIGDGWHIYSLVQRPGGPTPTSITLWPGATLAGPIEAPKPVRYDDPNFGTETQIYREAVTFRLMVLLPPRPAPRNIVALVRFQACNDRICLPPRTDTVRLTSGAVRTRPAPRRKAKVPITIGFSTRQGAPERPGRGPADAPAACASGSGSRLPSPRLEPRPVPAPLARAG